jgi:hypothetical protein
MDTQIIKTIFNAGLKFLETVIERASKGISDAIRSSTRENGVILKETTSANAKALGQLITRLEGAIGKIQEPTFNGEIHIDTKEFQSELSGLVDEMRLISKSLSTTKMEMGLKMIYDAISNDKDDKEMLQTLKDLRELISKLDKDPITTFKIDPEQFRAIVASNTYSGQGAIGLGGHAQQPSTRVTLTNLALTSSATEYSYTFPSGTTSWTIKLRDQGTLAYYAFVSGKMPSGGDSSAYATIPQNFLQSKDGIEWSGKTIYLGAEANSQVAEITVYKL